MKHVLWLALLASAVSYGQVTSTRDTPYDWRCTDSAGAKISDHQRFDTAFLACLNSGNGTYVQGGRYRIGRSAPGPEPEPAGTATLYWTAPTQNTDGSALEDLAGYRIHYGTSASTLTQTIQLDNPSLSAYVVSDLAPGTWYFAMSAYNAQGVQSVPSNVASKTVL